MKVKALYFLIILLVLLGGAALLGAINPSLFDLSDPKFLFLIVTVAALVDSINPCAISVLLLTIGFLISFGFENARQKILKIGGIYIFGIFFIYFLIGVGLIKTLVFFNVPHFTALVGSLILIFLGLLSLLNDAFPSFPVKFRIPSSAHGTIARLVEKSSGAAAFGLGVLVGLTEFPCTGGPYLLVLSLLYDNKTFLSGLSYLIWYNFVFVLPLIIILFIAGNKDLYEKFEAWKSQRKGKYKYAAGTAMILLGLIILFTIR